MSENNQGENGLFEMLQEELPAYNSQGNSKSHESFSSSCEEEHKYDFLAVQDMFLDHFFP